MILARFFYQWILHFTEKGDPTTLGPASATMFTAAIAGVVILGFRVFDAVTDPVAGALSDAWVRRGRERRSLLWFSFLLPAIGLVFVFAPTPEMSASLRWGVLASGLFVFYLGYTLYAIPYWSLVGDYSEGDAHRRGWLSNMLGIGMLLATGVGFVVSPMLIESYGFFNAALMFSVPAAALMILPYFARPRGLAAARPSTRAPDESLFTAFATAFRHRRFVATLLLFSGAQMSFTVMTAAASSGNSALSILTV
jgi:GPH family glycoside/pentoside/hexuronide:cation symporter